MAAFGSAEIRLPWLTQPYANVLLAYPYGIYELLRKSNILRHNKFPDYFFHVDIHNIVGFFCSSEYPAKPDAVLYI